MTITVVNTFPWQNPRQREDVNDDGMVTPLDALIVINYLNAINPPQPIAPAPYHDVSGDKHVAPNDVLMVINYLNAARPLLLAEGESGAPHVIQLHGSVLRIQPPADAERLSESSQHESVPLCAAVDALFQRGLLWQAADQIQPMAAVPSSSDELECDLVDELLIEELSSPALCNKDVG